MKVTLFALAFLPWAAVADPVAETTARILQTEGAAAGELDCSFRDVIPLTADGSVTLKQIMNQVDKTMTAEVTYAGQGWVSFGVTNSQGIMVGADAIIGLPDEPASFNNPGKYFLGSYSVAGVQLKADNQQTLIDASISQNATHTVLTYTKLLDEAGERAIAEDGGNMFHFATGPRNSLGYHNNFNAFAFTLSNCLVDGEDNDDEVGDSAIIFANDNGRKEAIWLAHGILMAIAWAVLVPIAIGSSMLRDLLPLPNGVWLKLHLGLNMLSLIFTIIGFALAVYLISQSPNPQHFTANRHSMLGLVIFIGVFIQALSGIFRPSLPHHDEEEEDTSGETKKEDSDDFESGADSSSVLELVSRKAAAATAKAAKTTKSTVRVIFEYQHRIFGALLLGLSWYNIKLGVGLFALKFGEEKGNMAPVWGVIGGISGTIVVLYIGSRLYRHFKKSS